MSETNEAVDKLSRRVRPHEVVGSDRKVVAASATAEPIEATKNVVDILVITAETNNTKAIAVGGSTVVAAVGTRKGTPLFAGDSMTLEGVDLNKIFLDSNLSGEGATYTYLK